MNTLRTPQFLRHCLNACLVGAVIALVSSPLDAGAAGATVSGGGSFVFGPNTSGAGGNATTTGPTAGGGGSGGGGSGGTAGSGTTTVGNATTGGAGGAAPSVSTAGGGGGGGANGGSATGSASIAAGFSYIGGAGGVGGTSSGFIGGAGGAGGYGFVLLSATGSSSNAGTLQGGAGGAAGGFSSAGTGGAGTGGTGLYIGGTSVTFTNTGTIAGGVGGVGLYVDGAGNTIIDSGTITGGTAIVLNGSNNTLQLQNGYSITGTVSASGTSETLALGGSSDATFDASKIGTQYTGFTAYVMSGTGTWTLTSTTGQTTAWDVTAGVLKVGADGALGSSAGTLTLEGGTLEASAGFTSSRAVTLGTGGGTIQVDNGGDTLTLSGAIGGTDGLTKTGAGTLTLTGANSYGGGTTVGAGTLKLSGSGTLGSTSGALTVNGGTLDLNGKNATVGIFSGTGGTVTNSSATGSNLTVDNGDSGTGAATYAGVIQDGVGQLGLTKTGTGALVLTGANTYTGGTLINSGTLEIDNASGSGTGTQTVYVASGGALRGTGTIGGDVQVMSGGALAAGTATTPGTLSIGGNLALASGSSTAMRIYSPTSYDKIAVTGTAALNGTLTLSYNGFVPSAGQTFQIVTATGGVTGTFSSVVNLLQNALTYNLSDVTLGVATVTATQTSFVPFGTNSTQTSVGRTLDSAAGDARATTLINYLNSIPGTSLAAAMQQIAPMQQTTVPPIVVQSAQSHFNTLNQRMSSVRSGSTGLALDQLDFRDQMIPLDALVASSGGDLPAGLKAFRPDAANKWGFFAAADGDVGEFTGGTGGENSTFFGAGFDGGADYRVTPDLAVGFSAGYNRDKQDFDDAGSATTVDTVRFGPYATWKDHGGDWLSASLGGGYHWFDSKRAGLGGQAASTTNGTEFDASLKYGHDFTVAKDWTLTPTLGLNYVHLDVDGYSESGSLAPLTVSDLTTQSLRSELGGIVSYAGKLGGVPLTPWVQAGWDHEFLDTSSALNARLASGAGSAFTASSPDSGAEIATFGAGLNASLTRRLTAALSYSGQANEAYQDHAFRASVRWDF